jgi:hypothetical protein
VDDALFESDDKARVLYHGIESGGDFADSAIRHHELQETTPRKVHYPGSQQRSEVQFVMLD